MADRGSKAAFPVLHGAAPRIQQQALQRGLMVYPAQGCADGTLGDHVLLAPSYTSTPQEIDQILALLTAAVAAALAG